MLVDRETLRRDIINLTKSNKKKEINLKIVFNYNKGRNNYIAYFIQPSYPFLMNSTVMGSKAYCFMLKVRIRLQKLLITNCVRLFSIADP